MAEHETIADIIAEKRRRADEIERDCAEKMNRGEMISDCYARELVADIRLEADRLEAAHKREVDEFNSVIQATASRSDAEIDRLRREIAELTQAGDCAKLREACTKAAESAAEIMERVRHKDGLAFNTANYIAGIAKAALAAPPRNCDVGTVADQRKRYAKMCQYNCDRCVLHEDRALKGGCEFSWAQLPYEEGGGQ